MINADASGLRQLTHNQTDEWNPAWSADGTMIAFISDRDDPDPVNCFPDCNYEIYVMNLEEVLEGIESRVQRLTEDEARDTAPVWSTDGERLAFFSDRDGDSEIYVMNADGTGVEQLTHNSTDDVLPVWRPNITATE